MPVVCTLNSDHIDRILEIDQAANPLPWSEISLASEFSNPHAVLLGVRDAGELSGFILIHLVVGEGHIVNFAVMPKFQSRGLGRFLLSEAISKIKDKHCEWLTLEVRSTNQKALALYRSVGFFEAGVRGAFYRDTGEDALLLKLSVIDWKRTQ